MDYKTSILAGLIYQIGYFYRRNSISDQNSAMEFVQDFESVLDKYCDFDLLKRLLDQTDQSRLNDAKIETFIRILQKARIYSNGQTGVARKQEVVRLSSIFQHIDIGKDFDKRSYLYKFDEYSPQNAYPKEHNHLIDEGYENLLQNFKSEMQKQCNKLSSFDSLYSYLYSLLLKYTWCVPGPEGSQTSDISLFDQMKVMGAIVACLYKYHIRENKVPPESVEIDTVKKFRLLVGDISGIQGYLFSGASIGAGEVAKRLRARSFRISMLSELASTLIIKKFDLPISNILMASGGKFYILLPNNIDSIETIKSIQKQIDHFLLDEYFGELTLCLASQPLSGTDFEQFGQVLTKVNDHLAINKNSCLETIAVSNKQWIEERFVISTDNDKGYGICKGCGLEFAVKEVDGKFYGERCLEDIKVGRLITKLRRLIFRTGTDLDIVLNNELGIDLQNNHEKKQDVIHIVNVNDTNIAPEYPSTFKFIANYIPYDEQALSFDELVNRGKGIKRLAYLKADVDNLGKIFSYGLQHNTTQHNVSISKVTTLSRMLDLFFTGCINDIVSEQFPNCYIVYSGGDDLLLAGPWNDILELAEMINSKFREFTCGNPNITLSAGISLAKTKTPVVKAVEAADYYLERSKKEFSFERSTSKDQITFFDRTMSWETFKIVIEEGQRLVYWSEKKKITRSDLWKLRRYDEMYQRFLHDHDVMGLSYKAFLAYHIGRSKREENYDQELEQWERTFFGNLNNEILFLAPIVDYSLYSLREE